MTRLVARVTLAGPLVTVDQAKIHLRITDSAHDADLAQKVAVAESAILNYLGAGYVDDTWTPATAPAEVTHAILLLACHYFEHRGDDLGAARPTVAYIWGELTELLKNIRPPALA